MERIPSSSSDKRNVVPNNPTEQSDISHVLSENIGINLPVIDGEEGSYSNPPVPLDTGELYPGMVPMVDIKGEQLTQMYHALEGISLIMPRLTTKGDVDEQTSRILESFLSLHRSISGMQTQQQQLTLMLGSMMLMIQRLSDRLDRLEQGINGNSRVDNTSIPTSSILIPTEPTIPYRTSTEQPSHISK